VSFPRPSDEKCSCDLPYTLRGGKIPSGHHSFIIGTLEYSGAIGSLT
jgi:hypothetical protein